MIARGVAAYNLLKGSARSATMDGRNVIFPLLLIAGLRFCSSKTSGNGAPGPARAMHMTPAPSGPTRLCAREPAWRRDDAIGRSYVADHRLWPGESGHFGNGGLLSLDRSAAAAQRSVTAGGGRDPVEISALGLVDADRGESCAVAYHTHTPDLQVVIGTSSFVRLYVVPDGESNPTMAVRTPDGHWRCNDDHGQSGWGASRAAVIDICDAPRRVVLHLAGIKRRVEPEPRDALPHRRRPTSPVAPRGTLDVPARRGQRHRGSCWHVCC
jgi:hypothetical protein